MSESNAQRCPLTYAPLRARERRYSSRGLRQLHPRLRRLEPLALTSEELVREAAQRSGKMSVGGVQPKLSAVLNASEGRFEFVDVGGRFLLKPSNPSYPEVPANEDLTMRMAQTAGVNVPHHGLLWTADDDLCYFVRRFDRAGGSQKLAVEDFAQLMGLSRETKYQSSMERVARCVETYCTFPLPQHVSLFRLTLVVYLTGNEDHHVKNFSILTGPGGVSELSPAYDLLSSTIALRNAQEELALPLRGKKSRLRRSDLIDYFGSERLGLPAAAIRRVLGEVEAAQPEWDALLACSFLSEAMRERYAALLQQRRAVLFA